MQTNNTKGRRLGRGLSGLIGTPVEVPISPPDLGMQEQGGGTGVEAAGQRILYVMLTDIAPGRYQPRKKFDEVALGELAASIKAAGLVQPIVVRLNPDHTTKYELVAGERRWRAAAIAGLEMIPAIVAAISEEQAAEWSLIENLQRADLSVMERAYAMKALGDRFGNTHAQVADKLGIERSSVSNLVRLLELPEEVRVYLENETLNAGHGKVLAGLTGDLQLKMAVAAAEMGWSVRTLEEEIARQSGAGTSETVKRGSDAEEDTLNTRAIVEDLAKQLGEHLGTKVRIKTDRTGKAGSIEIRFFDLDHFDGIMAMTGFAMK